MSEKVKTRKTKGVAKKSTRSSKSETVSADLEGSQAGKTASKTRKKTTKKSFTSIKTTTNKKKTSKRSRGSGEEFMLNEDIGNPPLEEIFEQASKYEDRHPTEEQVNSVDNQDQDQTVARLQPIENKDNSMLNVKLSLSLMRKIQQQADDEGLPLEDFVTELLAESVVLRAWEIVERKNQMRNPAPPQANGRAGNNPNNNRNHRKHRGMSHGRYQSIMDDKATFLEYVRNQERTRR